MIDDFDEALFLIDAESNQIMFQNKKTLDLFGDLSDTEKAANILSQEQFALCSSDLFKNQFADPTKTIEAIRDNNDFKSIRDIIKEALSS